MKDHTILFVYGTLKRGFGNHRLIEGCEYLGAAEAPGVLYGSGIPFAKRDDYGWIKGELYSVPADKLVNVDRLEGHPHAYTRTPVKLRDGRDAEIYYYFGRVYGGDQPYDEWPCADRASPVSAASCPICRSRFDDREPDDEQVD